jgi:uncharacterized protein (DUF305 family)
MPADPPDLPPSPTAPDEPGPGSRAVEALRPRGAIQIVVAVLAVCFLAGTVGYVIGGAGSGRPPSSAVDEGFLVDMSDHHDQAIQMSLCTVDRATEATVRHFAAEVLVFQSNDIGLMQAWLADREVTRPDTLDRPAMAWMGMATPASSMPGMATDAQLKELCTATGRDVDRLFLQLMREHHKGGIHMADDAKDRAADPVLRAFAAKMATNQTVEVNEYTQTLVRLGFE